MENISIETNQLHSPDFWQAEILGQIFDTNFSEMAQWVNEGALMQMDKVRRGNLRWIEAGKVPALMPFFNAKENNLPPPAVSKSNFQKPNNSEPQKCLLHSNFDSAFQCEICTNKYCENCVNSTGEIKIACPMCGGDCQPIAAIKPVINNSTAFLPNVEKVSQPSITPKIPLNQSFPSDVVKSEKKKGIGIFFVVLASILISGIIAYLTAYQFNSPNKSVEDSLPEIVELDEKFKVDEEREKKLQADLEAAKIKKGSLEKVNDTHIGGGLSGDCKMMPCNYAPQNWKNPMEEQHKKIKELEDGQAKNFISSMNSDLKGSYSRQRTKIIGDYRAAQSKRYFIAVFFGSFVAAFGGLVLIRKITSK